MKSRKFFLILDIAYFVVSDLWGMQRSTSKQSLNWHLAIFVRTLWFQSLLSKTVHSNLILFETKLSRKAWSVLMVFVEQNYRRRFHRLRVVSMKLLLQKMGHGVSFWMARTRSAHHLKVVFLQAESLSRLSLCTYLQIKNSSKRLVRRADIEVTSFLVCSQR